MKIIIQRVSHASCTINEQIVGEIGKGFLLFVCFEVGDGEVQIEQAVQKVANLRIFEDQNGKMNLNLKQADGAILSISQFTLSWDGRKGHRPSFDKSMPPTQAKIHYALFNKKLKELGFRVETGEFAADMKISLLNDGPVTFSFNY